MKCPKCDYEWESRILNPKECPRCKQRLDYFVAGAPEKRKGGVRIRATPRTWGTVAAILIVAVIVAWAITRPQPTKPASIGIGGGVVVYGAAPVKSGIENIYILKSGYDNRLNLSPQTAYHLAVITGPGQTVNIPYDVAFDIVIAYKAHGDNLGYLRLDNAQIEWKVSGAYTVSLENIPDAREIIFENTTAIGTKVKGTDNYMRVNVVAAKGWTLLGGQSVTLDPVTLWIWG